jgi:hypothetical protein
MYKRLLRRRAARKEFLISQAFLPFPLYQYVKDRLSKPRFRSLTMQKYVIFLTPAIPLTSLVVKPVLVIPNCGEIGRKVPF